MFLNILDNYLNSKVLKKDKGLLKCNKSFQNTVQVTFFLIVLLIASIS